jgi:hypothetical protein
MPKLDTIVSIKPEPEDKGRRKGIVRPRIDDEPWRRRKIPDQYLYLRVWDLGQDAEGADRTDLDRHFTFTGNSPVVTAFAAFNSLIFADNYENWDTIYKEITDSIEDYTIELGDFHTYVPGRGLRSDEPVPTVPEIHLFAQNKFFTTWLLPRSTKIKITGNPTNPVSTDPAVPFACDKDCDLFLVPGLHNRYGLAVYDPDQMVDADEVGYSILTIQAPLPRTLVGSAEFDEIWENRVNASAASVIDISFYRNLFLNDRNPQMLVEPPYTIFDPNGFPTYADHPPEQWDWTPRLGFTPATKPGGHLLAAIRKHVSTTEAEWYFVWAGPGGYSPSDPIGIGASGAWAYGFGSASIPSQPELFGLLV